MMPETVPESPHPLFYFKYSLYICGMVKDFIQYTEALELKQLGFDEPCFGVYATKDGYVRKSAYDENGDAPTYSQAFRFFREKYDLDYSLLPESSSGHRLSTRTFNIVIYKYHMNMNVQSEIVRIDGKIVRYNKREEAELACLKKLIEIANDKQ
jgi:hypothetical protein